MIFTVQVYTYLEFSAIVDDFNFEIVAVNP